MRCAMCQSHLLLRRRPLRCVASPFSPTHVCLQQQRNGNHFGHSKETAKPDEARAHRKCHTFHQYIRQQSAPFTGNTTNPSHVIPSEVHTSTFTHSRHVMEEIDVRPPWPHPSHRNAQTPKVKRTQTSSHVLRGQRDVSRLQQRNAPHVRAFQTQRLRSDFEGVWQTLCAVREALERPLGNSSSVPSVLAKRESVRFERLHQLRDATMRLTAAHFAVLHVTEILRFVELLSRIVTLSLCPNVTAHGYAMRLALGALFSNASDVTPHCAGGNGTAHECESHSHTYPNGCGPPNPSETDDRNNPTNNHSGRTESGNIHCLSGSQYYRLLSAILTLSPEERLEISTSTGPTRMEVFCVRQLTSLRATNQRGGKEVFLLYTLGPVRAVRVLKWCMQRPASVNGTNHFTTRHFSISSLPPQDALRVPFGVGKEYTQHVLTMFSSRHGKQAGYTLSNPNQKRNESLGVVELATLCTAIVFYEVTTPEALDVLVHAAPMCALGVDELSGHQLSCVLLAYATLQYHGDLSRHPAPSVVEFTETGKGTNGGHAYPSGHMCRQKGNFYMLLAQKAGELGERMHEDDAARVLRALEMAGVEHEMLRRSLESSMRLKALRHRSLLM